MTFSDLQGHSPNARLNINWRTASRGPSATAELLVQCNRRLQQGTVVNNGASNGHLPISGRAARVSVSVSSSSSLNIHWRLAIINNLFTSVSNKLRRGKGLNTRPALCQPSESRPHTTDQWRTQNFTMGGGLKSNQHSTGFFWKIQQLPNCIMVRSIINIISHDRGECIE